jgi:translation initiation factor eIF-2B subunit delta
MLAKEHRVPVVACVETYKFGERVTLDGVASNELGNGDDILDIPVNKQLSVKRGEDGKMAMNQANMNLTPLTLLYDLTPPSLITAVCTEVSFCLLHWERGRR